MARRVTIVNYGMGNLYSVSRAVEAIGAIPEISDRAEQIVRSDFVILPGVGAFGAGMVELRKRGLVDAVLDYTRRGRPFLGICLGMQMMLDVSEEFGEHRGLGLVPGRVMAIPPVGADGEPHKIPHIGWSPLLRPEAGGSWDTTALRTTPVGASAYFVHSFGAYPESEGHRIAETAYDGCRIVAVIGRDNLLGCQFHPEKSGPVGLDILREFLEQ